MRAGDHQDAAVEALAQAAQLNDDELLLVSDLVRQLAGAANAAPAAAAEGTQGLAAQLEQMLPSLVGALQQQQREEQQGARVLPHAAHVTGLHSPSSSSTSSSTPACSRPGSPAVSLCSSRPLHALAHAAAAAEATADAAGVDAGAAGSPAPRPAAAGAAQQLLWPPWALSSSPCSSVTSGRQTSTSSGGINSSEPAGPASNSAPTAAASFAFPPQLSGGVRALPTGATPAATAAAAASPAGDAGTQAAAEVLQAALADPHATVDDIVSLFDRMLSVSEDEALALQQLLVGNMPAAAAAAPPAAAAAAAAAADSKASARHQGPMSGPASSAGHSPAQSAGAGGVHRVQPLYPAISLEGWQAGGEGLLAAASSHSAGPLPGASAAGYGPTAQARDATAAAGARAASPLRVSSSSSTSMAEHHPRQQLTAQEEARGRGSRAHSAARLSSSTNCTALDAAAAAALRSRTPTASSMRRSVHAAPVAAAAEAQASARSRSVSPLDVERGWRASLRDASGSPPRTRSSSASPAHASPAGGAAHGGGGGGGAGGSGSRDRSPASAHSRGEGAMCWPGSGGGLYDAGALLLEQALLPGGGSAGQGMPAWDSTTRVARQAADTGRRSSSDGGGGAHGAAHAHQRQGHQQQRSQQQQPQRAPLRLPQHELEERMRRFYTRNVDWKRRCALVYARQQAAQAQEATQGCTFAPAINRRSEQIVQVGGVGGGAWWRCPAATQAPDGALCARAARVGRSLAACGRPLAGATQCAPSGR
jgi:hypothetical protein